MFVFCRGDSRVKSKIVNKVCKDMVYTSKEVGECGWKPNGAKRREAFKRGAHLEAADFAMYKFACM